MRARVPRPCLMPQPFLDCLPSKLSPRRDRVAPLRTTGSLAVIHCVARTRHLRPCHPTFHRLPHLCAVAWIPDELWVSFPRVRRPASWSPRVTDAGIAPFTSFTCFEAFFPPRIRSHRPDVSRAWWPLLSWVSAPLKTKPSKPRNLFPALVLADVNSSRDS
jgi:hypothetical protein